MPEPTPNHQLLTQIEAIVTRTRARRQRDRVIVGIAWTLAITLGTLLALASLDMLAPLEVPMRIAAAATLAALALGAFCVCIARPIVRPEPIARVAYLIERAIAGMHNRLITALDLRRKDSEGGARDSEAKLADPFVQRLLDQTYTRLKGFSPGMVADLAPIKRSITAAFATMLVGLLILGFTKERFTTAIERLLHPTASIAPISSITYDVIPRNASVLEGDGITLAAKFTKGSDPHMTVRIKPSSGVWTSYPLDPGSDGQPSFQLSSVNETTQYQVVGGGTWSPIYHIDVIRRPRVEQISAAVRLPEYMQIPQLRMIDGDLSVISAPSGATVELTAAVAGHASTGIVRTFKSVTKVEKESSEQELVWFEDSLPSDAEAVGAWRWVGDLTHSGTKAFTFDWARRPFGFKTRLAALPIGASSSLFVYMFLDPADAPGRVTVTAAIGARLYAIQLTDPARGADPAWLSGKNVPLPPNTVAINAGAMPKPGRWVRLTIPIEKIIGAVPAAPVEVTGLTFEADAGRVTFDRVGSVQTLTRDVARTQLEPLTTYAFSPDAPATQSTTSTAAATIRNATTNWVASIPVDKDCLFHIEFATEQNHMSPAVAPMSIVATADTAPKVVLEKPTRDVILAQPQPVPVMFRVFDDYGIADVGLQTGKSPTELEPVRWFKTYNDNVTSDLVLTSLDPAALKLTPGAALFFQLITRDRKGQIATSLPLRLALAAPSELANANVDKGSAPLAPIFDTLAKLVGAQTNLVGKAAGLVDVFEGKPTTQPAATAVLTSTQPVTLPEGKLDPKAQKTAEKQQEDAVAKAIAMSDAERDAMIKKLDEAAAAAQKSSSALPGEAQALATMSWQLQQAGLEQKALANAALASAALAEKQTEPNPELDKAVAERLKKLAELTDEQKKEMEDLNKQLKQLELARKDMATDPQAAQDRMQALLTEQRAQQANDQLDAMNDTLEAKRQELEDLKAQITALKEQTATASPEQLDAIAKAVAAAEKESLEEMNEMKDLLRDEMAGQNTEEKEDEMMAPWDPPGQENEATPVERDTPEKKKEDKRTPEEKKKAAEEAAKLAKEEEKKEWDDVPELPQIGSRTKEDERYKDKEQREDVIDDQEDPNEVTPQDSKRKRLEKSEGKFQQALTAAAKRAQASQSKMAQMQSEMNAAMQQMQQQSESSPAQAAKTAQQLQKMLNSDAMKSAASAARRAQQQAAAQQASEQAAKKSGSAQGKPGSDKPGSPTGATAQADGRDKLDEIKMPPMGIFGKAPEGVAGSDRGVVISVDLSGIDVSKTAAGFYKLPPHIRDPLIQSLKEAAPEGYQPLIDAYYRQLGAEGK